VQRVSAAGVGRRGYGADDRPRPISVGVRSSFSETFCEREARAHALELVARAPVYFDRELEVAPRVRAPAE
jgi:hypothetical protein